MAKKERIKEGKRTGGEKAAIWLISLFLAFVMIVTATVYAVGGAVLGIGAFAGVSALNLPKNGRFRSAIISVVDMLLEKEIIKPSGGNSNTYEVVFDTNGGEMPEGVKAERHVVKGKTIGALPVPEKEGYIFVGWFEPDYDKLVEIEATSTVDYDMELIAIWGEGINIYLNANGGTISKNHEVHEAIVGRSLGHLPTPVRAGYEFLGWYESGTDTLVNSVSVAEKDIEIVARWRPLDVIVAVEFSVGQGEDFLGTTPYFEIVRGERIASILQTLPDARCDGYRFIGWQDQNGVDITLTSKVEDDLVLSPVWEKIILCLDGTENHQYGAWQDYSDASCTEAAKRARHCRACGNYEFYETLPPKGHSFERWTISMDEYDLLVRERDCKFCDATETELLESITYSSFKTPIIDGDLYGSKPDPGVLINGLYNDTTIAGRGTSPITVTMEAREPTYVDIFTVTGTGSSSYTVTVVFEDGTEQLIGLSSFGETRPFEIKATVTKIIVCMQNSSDGQDYWQELGCFVIEK